MDCFGECEWWDGSAGFGGKRTAVGGCVTPRGFPASSGSLFSRHESGRVPDLRSAHGILPSAQPLTIAPPTLIGRANMSPLIAKLVPRTLACLNARHRLGSATNYEALIQSPIARRLPAEPAIYKSITHSHVLLRPLQRRRPSPATPMPSRVNVAGSGMTLPVKLYARLYS